MVQKTAPAKKKVALSKQKVKDMKVKPGKAKDVMGGGGRYNVSQPKTPTDPGCCCC